MLFSTAGKVFGRIILERLKAIVDKRQRDEQAGGRVSERKVMNRSHCYF